MKSIIGKTHLIHYGLEFLPFLEVLPNLVDQDAAWAKKFEDPLAESDDSYSMGEEEEDLIARPTDSPSASATSLSFGSSTKWGVLPSTVPASASRERKQSLPLTAKSLVMPAAKPSYSNNGSVDSADFSSKHILRELFKISQELNDIESVDVAQEITRMETRLFLDIKVRVTLVFSCATNNEVVAAALAQAHTCLFFNSKRSGDGYCCKVWPCFEPYC